MNILLLISMLLMTIAAYYLSHRNILAPAVIICAVFSLSSFFVVLNEKKWDFIISIDTFSYFIVAMLLTLIGICFGEKVKFTTNNHIRKQSDFLCSNDMYIGSMWMTIISIMCLFILYRYFQHQYAMSLSLGNSTGIAGLIYTLRSNVYDEEIFQLGTVLNIGISFMRASGFISLFLFINELVIKRKVGWRYTVPIVTIIIYNILITGRGGFIGLICATIYNLYYCLQKKGYIIKTGKMLRNIILGFVVFIILFWQLGKLTGNSEVLTFWDTMSIYIGSSILCFDNVINNTSVYNFVGTNTFQGVYNILSTFGIDVTTVSNHLEKVRWNGYSSNVFTAFNPYYLDFGPILSLVIVMIVGFIIGFMWRKFQKEKDNIFICVMYGRFIALSAAMYSIAERLISNTLALNAIVEIIFSILIIKVCIKKKHVEIKPSKN